MTRAGRRRPTSRTPPRRASAPRAMRCCLAALALWLTGCDRAAQPDAAPATAPATAMRSEVAGDWWVLAARQPTHGLSLSLVAASDARPPDAWEGSWWSFDWRGSPAAHQLARPSRPVSVSAQRGHDGVLVIHGPVPQLDAQGRPNGQEGHWQVVVEQVSLPGQPLRFSGTLRRDQEEPCEVELTTAWRPWAP